MEEKKNILHEHQEKYAKGYKDKVLCVFETGLGKTVAACVWLKDGRDKDALVVCPKRVVEKWKDELKKWGTKATVLSFENFKKTPHKKWSAIVVDEATGFASPLFVQKLRSKRTEHLYELLRRFNIETPIFLATATPIASSAWNLHTLLTFSGKYIDWRKWRERFFQLERRPYLTGMAWMPRPTWRKDVQRILKENSDIVLLKDVVSDVPREYIEEIETPSEKFVLREWEPSARFAEEHKHEQKGKLETIKRIASGYRKVLVVAHYREHCEQLLKELSKERETILVYGGTKDQESMLRYANEVMEEGYLIVQASLGAGFDADSFSCCIFAGLGYSALNHSQMKGRIKRIHNLHDVYFYYLLGGRCDDAVWKQIQKGNDFIPNEFMK